MLDSKGWRGGICPWLSAHWEPRPTQVGGPWVCNLRAGGHVILQLGCPPKCEADWVVSPVELIKAQMLKDQPRFDESQFIMVWPVQWYLSQALQMIPRHIALEHQFSKGSDYIFVCLDPKARYLYYIINSQKTRLVFNEKRRIRNIYALFYMCVCVCVYLCVPILCHPLVIKCPNFYFMKWCCYKMVVWGIKAETTCKY